MPRGDASTPNAAPADERALSGLLEQLDRLEDLLEEMDELGVASRSDVERRLAELNRRVDDLAAE